MAFSLEPTPSFRLDLTAWALRHQRDNLVAGWDGHTCRRVRVLNGRPLQVPITQVAFSESSRIKVAVGGTRRARDLKSAVTAELERLEERQRRSAWSVDEVAAVQRACQLPIRR